LHTSSSAGSLYASESGFEAVSLEVNRADDVLREVFGRPRLRRPRKTGWSKHGWPQPLDHSPLHEDYRLSNRLDTMQRPHHMISPRA
jgi:hypothetical protein